VPSSPDKKSGEAERLAGRPSFRRPAIILVFAATFGVTFGLGAHLLFSHSTQRLALPELHGQASWPTGKRPAPGFTLHDVLGGTRSLASTRGRVTLITFLDSRCHSLCPIVGRSIGAVQRELPVRSRPALLIVSVDPEGDRPASVRTAARRWRLEPGWHWLTGSRSQLAAVWHAYGIVVRPTTNDITHGAAVYLLDREGYERAGYLPPLLPNFVALDVRRVEAKASVAGDAARSPSGSRSTGA
jgi:cytochrome oxidase Cu insertion factor (SCO1/SenC/PrrC family)